MMHSRPSGSGRALRTRQTTLSGAHGMHPKTSTTPSCTRPDTRSGQTDSSYETARHGPMSEAARSTRFTESSGNWPATLAPPTPAAMCRSLAQSRRLQALLTNSSSARAVSAAAIPSMSAPATSLKSIPTSKYPAHHGSPSVATITANLTALLASRWAYVGDTLSTIASSFRRAAAMRFSARMAPFDSLGVLQAHFRMSTVFSTTNWTAPGTYRLTTYVT